MIRVATQIINLAFTPFKFIFVLVQGIINFFVPKRLIDNSEASASKTDITDVWVIIPSYKTPRTTINFVQTLNEFNPGINILIIDDCTPLEACENLNTLHELAKKNTWLTVIRNPVNQLTAGALNFGLEYLKKLPQKPKIVIRTDDDNQIDSATIKTLIEKLDSHSNYGAVCSQARVSNKNNNLLTRLQALEYHNFNISRTMDEGFFKGPLVMHGMLSAYRFDILVNVGGFTLKHLIEDYDLTMRIKRAGWQVGFAQNAKAWTKVHETLPQLWKQRVRWSYGGLFVLKDNINAPVNMIQDVIGHSLFLITLGLIIASYILTRHGTVSSELIVLLAVSALLNFLIATGFNVFTLFYFKEADWIDYLIRISIIPEFIYANLLSIIVIGSYLYFAYNKLKSLLHKLPFGTILVNTVDNIFNYVGYTSTWGTR